MTPSPTLKIVTAPSGFERRDSLLTQLTRSFACMADRIDPPSSMNRLDLAGLHSKAREETLLVGLINGEPLACAFAKASLPALYVGKVAVDPQLRRQGVAAGWSANERGADGYVIPPGVQAVRHRIEVSESSMEQSLGCMGALIHIGR